VKRAFFMSRSPPSGRQRDSQPTDWPRFRGEAHVDGDPENGLTAYLREGARLTRTRAANWETTFYPAINQSARATACK
jgi:hypothetical protein